MIHPSALALVAGSLLTAGLLAYAARWAVTIVRHWNVASGSSLQLDLERRTVLLSTIVRLVLAFQIAALFLFVHTADSLAPLFTGAMCAAGTLKASGFGYPLLLLELCTSIAAGLWLAVDHLDQKAPDSPLVRAKYAALVGLAPLVGAEAVLQALYFADLRPEVITSCCGSLFGRGARGLAGSLSALPPAPTAALASILLAIVVGAAVTVRVTGRGGIVLGIASAALIPVSFTAVIAVVSQYVYALPTHHCPFCLLQREYHFIGYALYAAILVGGVAGIAAAIAGRARAVPSLAAAAPSFQRRLAGASAVAFAIFAVLSSAAIASSDLRL
jgi:hypothetical protein